MPITKYVVLDFEATCDDVHPPPQEIIEFPSVLVDAQTFERLDEFRSYVKPTINPTLRPFCTELTGIEQATVDGAPEFMEVFQQHQEWLRSHSLSLNEKEPTWVFVTCGDWDLATMLPLQLQHLKISSVPVVYTRWVNIKFPFAKEYGRTDGKYFAINFYFYFHLFNITIKAWLEC